MKTERCTSPKCQAPIVFATTVKGKLMPIDAGVSEDGQWRLVAVAGVDTPNAFFVPRDERAGRRDLHASHFATCPEPQTFSKRQKGATR